MAANDAEIERTVRAYFDALAAGDDVAPYAAGPYADVTRVVRPRSASVDIRRLAVVEQQAERAVVDLDATLTATVDAAYGTIESALRYGGPLTAVRDTDGWKVADYAIAGRLRSDSLQLLDADLSQADLRLHVASLELRGDATILDARLENRGRTPVVVSEVRRGARDLGRWWWIPVPMWDFPQVEPGQTSALRVGWSEHYSLATPELRFVIQGGESGGPGRFAFAFAVVRHPEPQVVPLGEVPRGRRVSRRARQVISWGLLAAFAAPLLAHLYRPAAVLIALYGAAILGSVAVWGRRGRSRQILNTTLLGVAAFALAGFLWWYAR